MDSSNESIMEEKADLKPAQTVSALKARLTKAWESNLKVTSTKRFKAVTRAGEGQFET